MGRLAQLLDRVESLDFGQNDQSNLLPIPTDSQILQIPPEAAGEASSTEQQEMDEPGAENGCSGIVQDHSPSDPACDSTTDQSTSEPPELSWAYDPMELIEKTASKVSSVLAATEPEPAGSSTDASNPRSDTPAVLRIRKDLPPTPPADPERQPTAEGCSEIHQDSAETADRRRGIRENSADRCSGIGENSAETLILPDPPAQTPRRILHLRRHPATATPRQPQAVPGLEIPASLPARARATTAEARRTVAMNSGAAERTTAQRQTATEEPSQGPPTRQESSAQAAAQKHPETIGKPVVSDELQRAGHPAIPKKAGFSGRRATAVTGSVASGTAQDPEKKSTRDFNGAEQVCEPDQASTDAAVAGALEGSRPQVPAGGDGRPEEGSEAESAGAADQQGLHRPSDTGVEKPAESKGLGVHCEFPAITPPSSRQRQLAVQASLAERSPWTLEVLAICGGLLTLGALLYIAGDLASWF